MRSCLALAAALFAATTLLGSAAEACISCEYVPPVVYTPAELLRDKAPQEEAVPPRAAQGQDETRGAPPASFVELQQSRL